MQTKTRLSTRIQITNNNANTSHPRHPGEQKNQNTVHRNILYGLSIFVPHPPISQPPGHYIIELSVPLMSEKWRKLPTRNPQPCNQLHHQAKTRKVRPNSRFWFTYRLMSSSIGQALLRYHLLQRMHFLHARQVLYRAYGNLTSYVDVGKRYTLARNFVPVIGWYGYGSSCETPYSSSPQATQSNPPQYGKELKSTRWTYIPGKGRGVHRGGNKNYKNEEVGHLIYFVEEVLHLGSNECSIVAVR